MGKSGSTSKADTAVKLVLIFFISLLSFSVGTYVGKQVSDSDSRRAALEVDNEGAHHETAAAGHGTADAATAPIADEEVSSLTEEFLAKERKVASEETLTAEAKAKIDEAHGAAEAHGASAGHGDTEEGYTHHSKLKAKGSEGYVAYNKDEHGHATPAEHEAATPEHKRAPTAKAQAKTGHEVAVAKTPHQESVKASEAAERVSHDKAPAADPIKKREPSSVLPTVASTAVGKYTVQVASYATETEAKEQAAKLASKGFSAFYVPAEVNSKTWYRVSVGLFSDQKSASNYRTELLATQAVSSAIVQKIIK
jgi:cell division protein FtsN